MSISGDSPASPRRTGTRARERKESLSSADRLPGKALANFYSKKSAKPPQRRHEPFCRDSGCRTGIGKYAEKYVSKGPLQPALGDPASAGGLDWMTHRGPFQPLPFCDNLGTDVPALEDGFLPHLMYGSCTWDAYSCTKSSSFPSTRASAQEDGLSSKRVIPCEFVRATGCVCQLQPSGRESRPRGLCGKKIAPGQLSASSLRGTGYGSGRGQGWSRGMRATGCEGTGDGPRELGPGDQHADFRDVQTAPKPRREQICRHHGRYTSEERDLGGLQRVRAGCGRGRRLSAAGLRAPRPPGIAHRDHRLLRARAQNMNYFYFKNRKKKVHQWTSTSSSALGGI